MAARSAISIRYYLWAYDGPWRLTVQLHQDLIARKVALPQYAGTKQKILEVFARLSQAAGWNTVAELQILFLRPSDPGQLIGHEGDLDNRLKSLFDGLRMPSGVSELPDNAQPGPNEPPFFCLLQDDALVTGFSVVTDRLLIPVGRNEVDLTIHARVMATKKSMGNDVVW